MAGQDPRLRGEPLKHVLVIDDDVAMRHLIVEYLTIHAFKVTAVADSKQFNRVLCSETVDVVVVDLNLGREDGLEIVRSLATKSDVPIIIIMALASKRRTKLLRSSWEQPILLPSLFGTREFLARIRVALRVRPSVARTKDRRSFSFADWTLNLRRRRLISEEGSEVKLTAGEFNLLVAFLEKPRDVLSRSSF